MSESCRLKLLKRGAWECLDHKTTGGPGECAGFCPAGLAARDAALATLRAGIEYAHQLHTPEGMPDEPVNCAHPACEALATLAPGPTEGRDG